MKKSAKKRPSFLQKASYLLLLALPLILFFSYHPVISLGTNETMNLELSLPEIWLLLFFLVTLPRIKNICQYYGIKKIFFATIIFLYFSISFFWSGNQIRTILTAGILWLVCWAVLNIIYILKQNDSKNFLKISLTNSIIISAIVVSIFCWLQCILDVLGASSDYTLLCRGCVSSAFGFPHPNGFAIEPQFMGNLLIVPVLLCYYLLFSPFYRRQARRGTVALVVVTLFLSTTLFLTFSRGAIYAVVVGFLVEQIVMKNKKFFQAVILFFCSFAIALSSLGLLAMASPTNDTFLSGVSKAVHHLSLGKIDFRPEETKEAERERVEDTEDTEKMEDIEKTELEDIAEESSFSGYVEESTNRRLSLNEIAIRTWLSNPKYIIVGAGLGSAGVAMNDFLPDEIGPKEIVQNEYVSLLLESGIIGCVLILGVAIYIIWLTKKKMSALFAGVVVSFLLTLLFFSGLPNALQIYLLPALIFFL